MITAGTLSVGVGVVGIFLPLLPTTPFLLVAAACYVRSSNRLYRWLLTNRVTNSYIASYRAGKGIPARTKAVSICVLWITLAVSAFMVQIWWIWLILGAVAVGVPLFTLSLPTLERGDTLRTQAKFLIAGTLILGSIGFLMFTGISESMVTYYDVPQLLEKTTQLEKRGVRLTGQVKPGSINLYGNQSRVDFLVYDQASTLSIPVTYQGDIPDTFQERAEVVVEGRYDRDEQLFHANVLLAKCPSKYEQQDEIDRPVDAGSLIFQDQFQVAGS